MVFIHGFAMHSEPYGGPIAAIVEGGGQGLLYDLPGHGGAPGRVSGATLEALFASIAADVPDPPGRLVLAGESLGCAYLEQLASGLARRGRAVDGFALFAAPLLLNPLTLARWAIDAVLTSPRQLLANRFPLRRPIAESVSDRQWRQRLLADPKVKRSADAWYLLRSGYDVAQLAVRLRRMTAPAILLQGSNDELNLRSSLGVSYRLCGAQDKRKVMIDGASHSLFWDPRTPEVVSEVRAWLGRVLA